MTSAAVSVVILVSAAIIGGAVGVVPSLLTKTGAEAASYSEPLFTCTVTDATRSGAVTSVSDSSESMRPSCRGIAATAGLCRW